MVTRVKKHNMHIEHNGNVQNALASSKYTPAEHEHVVINEEMRQNTDRYLNRSLDRIDLSRGLPELARNIAQKAIGLNPMASAVMSRIANMLQAFYNKHVRGKELTDEQQDELTKQLSSEITQTISDEHDATALSLVYQNIPETMEETTGKAPRLSQTPTPKPGGGVRPEDDNSYTPRTTPSPMPGGGS